MSTVAKRPDLSDWSFVRLTMRTEQSQRKYDGLIDTLMAGNYTSRELQEKIFASKTRTNELLKLLNGQGDFPRQVFVVRWLRDCSGFVAVYALGNKPDAPLPKRLTASQRHQKIQSNKATKERHRASILECRRRCRRKKYPGLSEAILEAVKKHSNQSTPQIAKSFGLAFTTIYSFLCELEDEQQIMRSSPKNENPIRWAFYVEPELIPKQTVRKEWAAPNIKPQGIFAALGL